MEAAFEWEAMVMSPGPEHKPLTFHQIQARVRHQSNWFQHQNQHQNKIRHPHQKWNSEPKM